MTPLDRSERRALGALPLALALLVPACSSEPSRGGAERPDVILIVIDTLRADRLSCYGYERPTTPRLDRLAAEGALFEDTTAQSSWTLPSMVSMLTGTYVTEYRDVPDDGTPMLAETFQAAGYHTIGVVGNYLLRPQEGFARGFDYYDERKGRGEDGELLLLERTLDVIAQELVKPLTAAFATDDEGRRRPVFLYLHVFDPHNPYQGRPYLDAILPTRESLEMRPEGWQAETLAALRELPRGKSDWKAELEEIRHFRGLYDQDIRFTDDWLARILDRLEELGGLETAIVAVLSDHGECLWERTAPVRPEKLATLEPKNFFYQQHGAYLYEEAIRTPFILWGKGVPAGVRVTVPVENVDLFPTLLELTGVAARGELHGRSLVPLLRGETPSDWRETIHSYVLHGASVREIGTGKKLIVPSEHGTKAGGRPALYDLDDDPYERNDRLAEETEHVRRLEDVIRRWKEDHPTESTLGQPKDPELRQALRALGYAGEHTGNR